MLALGRQVQECGGDEIGSLEDLKVAFGVVMALGAVDDGFSGGVPGDFLQREWMSQQILGESLATTVVVGIDEVVTAIVNVKSGMFPTEQIAQFVRADEFLFPEDGEEAKAKQLGHRADGSLRQAVKAPVGGKQAVSDEHVEMGMEDEVIAKSMNGGDGSDFAFGKIELEAKGFGQGIDRALEQKRKQLAAFAKDAAQHFGNGENHLSMRDLMAYRSGDPFTGGTHATLMASGTKVASFAGEGE